VTDSFSVKALLRVSLSAWALQRAMTNCAVLRIEKRTMMDALHRQHAFSDLFVAYLLARNIRYDEDLVDHFCIERHFR